MLTRLLHHLPPETAHSLAIRALGLGLVPDARRFLPDAPVTVAGVSFPNTIGLAAGFDKNADALPGLAKLGFGFLEVGTVTPRPQPGNAAPRLFRLSEDQALINRLGFNNKGHASMRRRLETAPAWIRARCRLGVNIGKNKDSGDAAADYALGITVFSDLADYLVVNISSPNTPGLRTLQEGQALRTLLEACANARAKTTARPPVFLKIAPDMDDGPLSALVEDSVTYGLDGLIISNTTIARPESLQSLHKTETGGLSGAPLFAPSTALLRSAAAHAAGRLALIGVGGIRSPADAAAKYAAGAALVQLYSGFIYQGPALIRQLCEKALPPAIPPV